MNRVRKLLLLAVAAMFSLPVIGVAKEPATSYTPESIKKLVGDLDHDHYQTREKATEELVKIGAPAIAPLAAAFQGSAESQWRAVTILEQIAVMGEDAAFDEVISMFEALPEEDRLQTESFFVNLKTRRITQRNLHAQKTLQAKGAVFYRDDSPELAISFPDTGGDVVHASPYSPVSPSFGIPAYGSASPTFAPTFSPEPEEGIIILDGDFETIPAEIPELSPVSPSYSTPLPVEESLEVPEDVERILEIAPAIEDTPIEFRDYDPDTADPVPFEDEAVIESTDELIPAEFRFPDAATESTDEAIPAVPSEGIAEGYTVVPSEGLAEGYTIESIDVDSADVTSGTIVWEDTPYTIDTGVFYVGPSGPGYGYGGGGFGGALPYPGAYVRPQPQPENVLVLSSEWRGDDKDLAAIGSLAYVTHIVVEELELSPTAIRSLFSAPSLRRVTLTNTKYESAALERAMTRHENVNVWTFGKAVLGVTGDPAAIPFQVATIHPETGAVAGGIEPGDIFLKVDGDKLKDFSTLTRLVAGKMPGDKITVTVKRGEETLDLTCILSAREKLTVNQ